MNRKQFVSLVPLLAIVAFAVVPVTAQAAAPEYGRCVKSTPKAGGYTTAGCLATDKEDNDGAFEWFPGPGPKPTFTSKGGVSSFETVTGRAIGCKTSAGIGTYTGAKTDSETLTFTGCEYLGAPCQNGLPGEVVTKTLTSVLGIIKTTKSIEVGVSLEGPGGVIAEFACAGRRVVGSGSVIVPLSSKMSGKMLTTVTEKFAATKGKQKPEKFANEPKDTLTCSVFEGSVLLESSQCGFTNTVTVTNEEPIEVNGVL
jgi:hypothetical protein